MSSAKVIAPFDTEARAEIKGLAHAGGKLWLATSGGLVAFADGACQAAAAWLGKSLTNVAAGADGTLFVLTTADHKASIFRCDSHTGVPTGEIKSLPETDIKCVLETSDALIVGGKKGLFRRDGETWLHVLDANVSRLETADKELRAYLKSMPNPERTGAATSRDGGRTWQIRFEGDIGDAIQAIDGDRFVSRWRHRVEPGEPVTFHTLPAMAALLTPDWDAIMAGHVLTIRGPERATVTITDPGFSDSDLLAIEKDWVVLTGRHGGFAVHTATGRVVDLVAGLPLPSGGARFKQMYNLGGKKFLITTTYGTYRSADAGKTWRRVKSIWNVHHGKTMVVHPDGKISLACKGSLWESSDDGVTLEHVPVSVSEHALGELSGVNLAGNVRVLGTKRGLIAELEPGRWQWLPILTQQKVKHLLSDGRGRLFGALFDKREIHAVDLRTGKTELLAALGEEIEQLFDIDGSILVLLPSGLSILDETKLRPLKLPEPGIKWHGLALAKGRLLLWTKERAWIGNPLAGEWTQIENWPGGAKKAAATPDGSVILTGNSENLWRLELTDQPKKEARLALGAESNA